MPSSKTIKEDSKNSKSKTKKTEVKVDKKNSPKDKDKDEHKETAEELRARKYPHIDFEKCPKDITYATFAAGLELNINDAKKWLEQHYSDNYKYYEDVPPKKAKVASPSENKDEDEKPKKKGKDKKEDKKSKKSDESSKDIKKTKERDTTKVPMSGLHYVLTAADQVLCTSLVSLAYDNASKGISGLYEITDEHIRTNIKLNNDFANVFERALSKFEPTQKYITQLIIPEEKLKQFIEKHAFNGGGNTNVHLSKQGFNLLCYIMLQNRIVIARNAYWSMVGCGRRQIKKSMMKCAVNSVHTGPLLRDMIKKIEETLRRESGENFDLEEKNGSKDSKKGSSDEKKTKKDKKNKKHNEEESEDESEQSSDESEDDETEEESDSE